MRNIKTTICGVLTMLAASISMVIVPMLDGVDATQPDWGTLIPLLTAGIAGILAADGK